ncbi:unnamed protein product [Diatraea saccharalis]|uniref:Uncharacterized protein n=1 Tax=Diatraea saccharalis TaxID=40085 RepID=A0A9N9R1C6_9NEOP|nr:unnamed protein product [Diatraea saccharalis]
MNRNQRRLGRQHQKRLEEAKYIKTELEEVLSPKSKRDPFKLQRFTTNKCCHVAPTSEDFGQSTDDATDRAIDENELTDKYQNILKEQFGFDPLMPETIKQLKELRKVLCNNTTKVENCSQYAEEKNQSCSEFANIDGTNWQTVDNEKEIDKYISHKKGKSDACLYMPENVRIIEPPRIKIIAKKFSKCKRNNIELRKLDEKVACVEYDVFIGNDETPREKLRAFFSIKPKYGKNGCEKALVDKFNKVCDDLKKFPEKEIEIIGRKIEENKSYLDDLKRILRRKQAIFNKKNRNTLDLMSLYEMAKRESPPLADGFSSTNFLSKAELQEMKNLILKKCGSSVHGINRRTLKEGSSVKAGNMGFISQSIVDELWRETGDIDK